jgi:tetratricopeptide (TPR) repeat protein
MDWLRTVNAWIVEARSRISNDVHIPLISDDVVPEMGGELFDAWMLGDHDLKEALDNVLSRNPDDTAARFLALSAYFQLLTMKVVADEEEVKSKRQAFRRHLAYVVRLREVDQCTSLRDLRWEITNSLAVADYQRADALTQRLKGILPLPQYSYLQGRLHFLVALAHTWDTEETLERWDLPIGSQPKGLRRVWAGLNALVLYSMGVSRPKIAADITEDERNHFHDSIKHLDQAVLTSPPSGRFMIARSYIGIGDNRNASQHYQWLIDHQDEVRQACATEVGPAWNNETIDGIFQDLHEAAVTAYERAGAVPAAIDATYRWIKAFPTQLGTFERLARIYQQSGDYHAAYEWLRKEADRNPTLSEDPNVSIALALGSIGTLTAIEGVVTRISNTHKEEWQRVGALLLEYWPTYARLAPESQERWSTGAWLRNVDIPHSAGLAAHSFAWVVERELRTTIMDRFRTTVTRHPLNVSTVDDEVLGRYLQSGIITLGQMVKTIERSSQIRSPLLSTFRDWLEGEHPWLAVGLQRLRTDKIIRLRNREDHADLHTMTATDASTMRQTCYDLLNLLHQNTLSDSRAKSPA